MRKLIAPVILFSLSAMASQTRAGAPTANETNQMKLSDLKKLCDSSGGTSKTACKFYILGAFEGLGLGAAFANDTKHFCIPAGLSSDAMVLNVRLKVAGDSVMFPEDKDIPAISFVSAVVRKTYPCGTTR